LPHHPDETGWFAMTETCRRDFLVPTLIFFVFAIPQVAGQVPHFCGRSNLIVYKDNLKGGSLKNE